MKQLTRRGQFWEFALQVLLAMLIGAFLCYTLTHAAHAACHHYSIWKNPWPQHCPLVHARVVHVAQRDLPPQPPTQPFEETPRLIMPLPTLDAEFPPDCAADWCQRLRLLGIGRMRESNGTN